MSMDINIKYSLRPCMVAIRKGGDERKAERLAGRRNDEGTAQKVCGIERR